MTQRIIDGEELFAQVCRTYDEFIGLDDLAELMDKMPTVEAIPIEWIKDWRKEKWFDRRLSMEERMVRAMVARMILEDWEDENGTENN